MKVLIVDDELHVLKGLKYSITWNELGFDTVDIARNGHEALESYRNNRPDLLITDMYMPEMNGIELIRTIREKDVDLPVVILSGYNDFSLAQQALQLNVSRYILKPCIPQDIVRELKDVLLEIEQKRQQTDALAEMRERITDSIPILREQYLSRMITVGFLQRELTSEKIDFYELSGNIRICTCVMSLKVSSPEMIGNTSEYSWQVLKSTVYDRLLMVAEHQPEVYVLRYLDDKIPILICANSPDSVLERAKIIADEIIDTVHSGLQLDVVIGIGRPYLKSIQYPLSYKESVEALILCESEGFNQYLIYEEDHSDTVSRWLSFPFTSVKHLTDAILCLDGNEVHAIWDDMASSLSSSKPIPVSLMQSMCISILGNLIFRIIESGNQILDQDGIARALDSIQQQHSVKSLLQSMQDKLNELLQALQKDSSERKESPYVAKIKRIVTHRFHEQIVFSQLALDMNISRNYLSNIFKKETGVSFMTYLTNYRIEKAKELLIQRQYMVYEIAERVGYQDAAYFSRIFKNTTGFSPLEFIMQDGK
jgi:YesN/AraC family two-component response regulator